MSPAPETRNRVAPQSAESRMLTLLSWIAEGQPGGAFEARQRLRVCPLGLEIALAEARAGGLIYSGVVDHGPTLGDWRVSNHGFTWAAARFGNLGALFERLNRRGLL